ncbi:phosphatase PAP2 family protein [Persicimonas caeni]|uniref:Phosphatase PAP2 family protein n=1 Tax=Persicimonas caeni TaxID=2292766 RepID=A0A4Y6PLZ7_PERCE|nr:phosphatase PAP2 family protein [Persicimonas caeni]QDG49239.1 phosphatase PAP2 family protein [Persicimonas caeni]QED30460.1 phosphatase PAP2 family protein [Persicimonas caeni]
MYRFFDFLRFDQVPDKPVGELPWHYPYGLLEKIWLVVWALIGLTGAVYREHIAASTELFGVSIAVIALVLILPQITIRLNQAAYGAGRIVVSVVSSWATYERSAQFLEAFRSTSYEMEMLLADRLLFGGNPSEWTEVLINPVLTEYLQLTYVSYFPMMLLVALALFFARKNRVLFRYLLAMNLAMVSCHFFYILVPVRSPFLIADDPQYASLISYSIPLQGLWWTEHLRQNLLDATVMRYDCFPSGHTMHSMLAIYFGWKTNRAVRAIVTVVGVSIIFSTIYLRYHYAIDLVAGAGFAVFWIWASAKMTAASWNDEPTPQPQLSQKVASVLQHFSGNRPD